MNWRLLVEGEKTAARRRDFSGRRTLVNLLRALHLVGVVGSGAAILGALPPAEMRFYAILLVVAGLGMVALDLWANPEYFRHINGMAILVKLGLLMAIMWLGGFVETLFWFVLVGSVLLAHAPGRWRHRRILPLARRS